MPTSGGSSFVCLFSWGDPPPRPPAGRSKVEAFVCRMASQAFICSCLLRMPFFLGGSSPRPLGGRSKDLSLGLSYGLASLYILLSPSYAFFPGGSSPQTPWWQVQGPKAFVSRMASQDLICSCVLCLPLLPPMVIATVCNSMRCLQMPSSGGSSFVCLFSRGILPQTPWRQVQVPEDLRVAFVRPSNALVCPRKPSYGPVSSVCRYSLQWRGTLYL